MRKSVDMLEVVGLYGIPVFPKTKTNVDGVDDGIEYEAKLRIMERRLERSVVDNKRSTRSFPGIGGTSVGARSWLTQAATRT